MDESKLCDGCGHPEHPAHQCPITRYGERCACDEPVGALSREDAANDLVVWLRVQLDEDAARVAAAPPGPWSMDASGSIVDADGGKVIPSVGGARDRRAVRWPEGPVLDHVISHDPARVLREIDAKRKLLTRWRELQERIDAEPDEAKRGNLALTRHGLDMFVYQLGTVYADRTGYQESWRP